MTARGRSLGYRSPPTNTGMKYLPRTEAYERLQLDGGWLSVSQLAMECGQTEATVDRTLRRQVSAGWLEHRVVDLGTGDWKEGLTSWGSPRRGGARVRRVEYRALMHPPHWPAP